MSSDDATRRAGAILTVDLGAIAANWRGLRDAGRAAGRPVDCAPVLNHLGQLNAWRAAAQRFNRPLDAIIHIDTGMHRLGFGAEEAQALINERGRLRGLRLALLMSHLVASEEPNNAINGEQLSRFRNFVRAMPGAPTSLANSSGIFLGPDYHFDLLRPGAALYGINPLPGRDNPMLPVVTLQARIL